MRDRAAVLAEEPYCRTHLKQGKRVRAVEVDHIVPLSRGGGDERANKQGLCKACHEAKSAAERLEDRRSSRADHP
jgi:5-methylcytosine-specific restriction protein A